MLTATSLPQFEDEVQLLGDIKAYCFCFISKVQLLGSIKP
jgi:hypothetical protein